MPKHHLFVGTWTPPGAIFTFEFDDQTLDLSLIKRTEIPKDEPISWMTISVRNVPSILEQDSQLKSMTEKLSMAPR